ncbi:DNA repair protein RadA [Actinomyces sp. zg-332]|uniref:DNA repair protein RadA n=1 Tax=Actinomyces sp. zg-332 TaxID=2708340 RepID=UPI001422FBB1|nr:DNA repair protein RadA [Actinomyces sp. zg-332]QPK94043.1 DNA repair protein RadA [Actinomyces sp. zg-332]
MAKNGVAYICSECGWETSKWQGQCRQCKSWSSLEENTISEQKTKVISPTNQALPITEISTEETSVRSSGISELDRVLGQGIVPGAVILLAGEPGVGKSTLLMEVTLKIASKYPDNKVLYISGEESASQVVLRAKRIGALQKNILLASENNLSVVLGHIKETKPSLVIVDSIQTISANEIDAVSGSTLQVKTVANQLISVAKTTNTPIILVGHVTKDGTIAGPRVLEHLVDVVCQFEGERFGSVRMLRAVKNRFGPTDEVGCFEINENGMQELLDPSGLFISENRVDTAGTCVSIALDGRRPMPIEIQSLVAGTNFAAPRRATSGVDSSRVAMMLAVLQSRAGISVQNMDVYVSTVGGAKINDIALDLPVVLAIISAFSNKTLPADLIAFGEVGLTGDIRKISAVRKRLQQAVQLGFKTVVLPANVKENLSDFDGLKFIFVSNIAEVVDRVFQR